jgi:hypothetical protein
MKSIIAGLMLAFILSVPASSMYRTANNQPEPYLTGYILIAHQCSEIGEIVLLIFSDGSFVAQLVALVPEEAWPLLAEARKGLPSTVYLVRGPFDTCPRKL